MQRAGLKDAVGSTPAGGWKTACRGLQSFFYGSEFLMLMHVLTTPLNCLGKHGSLLSELQLCLSDHDYVIVSQ